VVEDSCKLQGQIKERSHKRGPGPRMVIDQYTNTRRPPDSSSSDHEGLKDHRYYVHSLNLRLVVTLYVLRAEVLQAHGGIESGTNCVQVGLQSDRLQSKSRICKHHHLRHQKSWLVLRLSSSLHYKRPAKSQVWISRGFRPSFIDFQC
jgi:hypothetical protein